MHLRLFSQALNSSLPSYLFDLTNSGSRRLNAGKTKAGVANFQKNLVRHRTKPTAKPEPKPEPTIEERIAEEAPPQQQERVKATAPPVNALMPHIISNTLKKNISIAAFSKRSRFGC